MNSDEKMTGLKKRQQVAQTNKNIFIWVAGASVLVTICAVMIQFLVQQAFFNQKVIGELQATQGVLESNVKNIEQLKQNVNQLRLDPNLAKVKVKSPQSAESSNLQVILDALPTQNDGATFANSMATVILPLSGVLIESLTAGTQTAVVAGGAVSTATVTPEAQKEPQTLPFTTSITGSYDQISRALLDIERVIRPIKITKLSIQGTDASLAVAIQGVTYYLPGASVELGSKSVKP